ncbi:MAG: Asp23/Gls24 family envelope stress response protein [Myxococcota bacterium]
MAEKKNVTIEDKPAGDGVGGRLSINEAVVATIAGLAARDIPGIAELGTSRIIDFGDSPTRGVAAEVGDMEAALDIDVVINYGEDLRAVADQLRRKVAAEVDKMAGRQVVEVNINVKDIRLPEGEQAEPTSSKPRVR